MLTCLVVEWYEKYQCSSTLLPSLILLRIYNRQCCTNQPSRTIFISFSVRKWQKIQFSFLYCFSSSFSTSLSAFLSSFRVMLDFPKKLLSNGASLQHFILLSRAFFILFYIMLKKKKIWWKYILSHIFFPTFKRTFLY